MARLKHVSCSIMLVLLCMICACKKETPELASASLWPDSAWALYDIDRMNSDGSVTKGTLRIASVGKQDVDGQIHHWLEIREDSETEVKITKFFAKEKANFNPEDGFTFWENVKEIIVQTDANTPEQVPPQHLKRFSPYFIEDSSTRRYGNVENVTSPQRIVLDEQTFIVNDSELPCSGIKNTKHFTSSVNLGFLSLEDTTESSVEFYSNPVVPFGGIVKVVYRSNTVSVNKLKPETPPKPPQHYENTMLLKSHGVGATTQIVGTPTEMKVMPFPFLEAAKKSNPSR